MKLKNLAAAFLVVMTLASCKDEKKAEGTDTANTPLPETFDVTFNLTIPADDTFQLYFTEDGTLNFEEKNSVKTVVKGQANAQDVIFKLPQDVVPSNIRLDFGSNKQQGAVKVNSLKIKYFDKTFEAKDSLVTRYFYMNPDLLSYDPATSSVKAVVKNGVYDPLMWNNQLLSDEIKKIVK